MSEQALPCAALVVVSETFRLHRDARDMVCVAEDAQRVKCCGCAAGVVVSGDDELAQERARQLEVMKSVVAEQELESNTLPSTARHVYNPLKENPLRSNADNSCAWELHLLSQHCHPSVALFAKQILDLSLVQYDGDPLLDFSLASFLDRFAYKAPKKNVKRRPADHEAKYDKKHASFAAVAPAVDSKEFLNQKHVRPEEQFMHDHMKARQQQRKEQKQDVVEWEESDLLLEQDDLDDVDDVELGDMSLVTTIWTIWTTMTIWTMGRRMDPEER
jgi:hypothetical protein